MEPKPGIEPETPDWKSESLPLTYFGKFWRCQGESNPYDPIDSRVSSPLDHGTPEKQNPRGLSPPGGFVKLKLRLRASYTITPAQLSSPPVPVPVVIVVVNLFIPVIYTFVRRLKFGGLGGNLTPPCATNMGATPLRPPHRQSMLRAHFSLVLGVGLEPTTFHFRGGPLCQLRLTQAY